MTRARMWKGESLINQAALTETIEDKFQSKTLDLYVETMLENGTWPTDQKAIHKIQVKNAK